MRGGGLRGGGVETRRHVREFTATCPTVAIENHRLFQFEESRERLIDFFSISPKKSRLFGHGEYPARM